MEERAASQREPPLQGQETKLRPEDQEGLLPESSPERKKGHCKNAETQTTNLFRPDPPICPPSSRLTCFTVQHMIIIWLMGCIVMMSVFPIGCDGGWGQNRFHQMVNNISKEFNRSSCWLCSHGPSHHGQGWPITVSAI